MAALGASVVIDQRPVDETLHKTCHWCDRLGPFVLAWAGLMMIIIMIRVIN